MDLKNPEVTDSEWKKVKNEAEVLYFKHKYKGWYRAERSNPHLFAETELFRLSMFFFQHFPLGLDLGHMTGKKKGK